MELLGNTLKHKKGLVKNMIIKMRKRYQYVIVPTQEQMKKIEQNNKLKYE